MLTCSSIAIEYELPNGSKLVPISDFNLEIESGAIALMGTSGSGKSSLLRVIAGLQKPKSGSVVIDGFPVTSKKSDPSLDPRVSLIQQNYGLVSFLDVEQNLQLPRQLTGKKPASRSRITNALEMVGLGGFNKRRPATLSGGQQQRVAIARSLIGDSKVILADEPTGALDVENSLSVAHCFLDLSRTAGVIIIVATHDTVIANQFDRIVDLADLEAAWQ